MQPKPIIISIVGILLLALGFWFYSNWEKYAPSTYVQESETGETTTINTDTGTTTPGAPMITLAEVALHKDATSCYTVISGKVYDLTLWVNMHPGGKQAILSLCGIDGTARFMAKHATDEKPTSALARFYIANLGQ